LVQNIFVVKFLLAYQIGCDFIIGYHAQKLGYLINIYIYIFIYIIIIIIVIIISTIIIIVIIIIISITIIIIIIIIELNKILRRTLVSKFQKCLTLYCHSVNSICSLYKKNL